jgi:hypothetical protein
MIRIMMQPDISLTFQNVVAAHRGGNATSARNSFARAACRYPST